MDLLKLLNGKFSIALSLAVVFTTLTANAAAAQSIFFNSYDDGIVLERSEAANHPTGANILFADGSVRFPADVFGVLLPNSPLPYDRVDANEPDAPAKIRALFDAAERMQSAVVLSVPRDAINVPARFRTARLTVGSGESRIEIKMKDVLVSSWNDSGSSAAVSVSMVFTRIR